MAIVVAGAKLIDGTGAEPTEGAVVVIDDGRIQDVGRSAGVSVPRDARVIDAGGLTIMPGLIDCHLHSTYRARNITEHLRNTPSYNILRSIEILRETLACGVTTARDMGGADAGFRRAIDQGLIDGPRLKIAVGMISQSGGHGDSWVPAGFRMPKREWLPTTVADGPDAMRRLARELLMSGADFLKVCTSGGITSITDHFDEPQMSVGEIRAVVEEAAARGKGVAAHAEGTWGIRRAIEGGVESIEHGWFLDEECIDRMVAGGVWWVPTLALVELGLEHRRQPENDSWAAAELASEEASEKEIHRRQLQQIPIWREAVSRGVKIAMGTDQSHRLMTGENLRELRFMTDWLGMAPMDVITAATSRAAELLRRDDLGSIAPGNLADLIAVEGDPLEDLRILEDKHRIKLIMKAGNPFKCEIPLQAA